MKIQHLAVIFVIIIMPISIVLSNYVGNLIDVANKEAKYNSILLNSTYDAVRAYQINTLNNEFASVSASRVRDLNASINSFFNSLATGISSSAYTKTELNGYVPAILFTLYDGYYVYGPHENYAKIIKKTVDATTGEVKDAPYYIGDKSELNSNPLGIQGGQWTESNPQIATDYGLKPYTYYSCEYKGPNYHLIVNYTLDNYIAVSGTLNGEYITSSGYYINPNKVQIDNYDEKRLTLITDGENIQIGPEVLGEYVQLYDAEAVEQNTGSGLVKKRTADKQSYHRYFNYINYNETKYYFDDSAYYILTQPGNEAALQYQETENRTYGYSEKEYDPSTGLETTVRKYIPIFKLNKNLKEFISEDELNTLAEWRDCTPEELMNKSKFNDVNNFWYYYHAKEFSEGVAHDALSQITLHSNGENGYTEVKTQSFNKVFEIETNDGVKANDGSTSSEKLKAHEKGIYDGINVFDYNLSGNDPELESSYFNAHRMDVIISSIESTLADVISDFNVYVANTYSFRMPTISEDDWYKIANNVNAVAFMQGQPIGNFKFFNNYAIVTDSKTKEFISRDAINVQDYIPMTTDPSTLIYKEPPAQLDMHNFHYTQTHLENLYRNNNTTEDGIQHSYHAPGCTEYHNNNNSGTAGVRGYRLIDYDVDSFLHDYKNVIVHGDGTREIEQEPATGGPLASNIDKDYTEGVNSYRQAGSGGYECIVSRNNDDWTFDELMSGHQQRERKDINGNVVYMNTETRRAYISALAREKGASFRNFSMLNIQTADDTMADRGINAAGP